MDSSAELRDDFEEMSYQEFLDYIHTLGEVPASYGRKIVKELGRRQQHKGMTAVEFERASSPPLEEWAPIANEHRKWLNESRLIRPLYLRIAYGVIGAVGAFVYLGSDGDSKWVLQIAGALAIMDVYALVKGEGYIEGLRAGVYEGVKRGRDLTDDEIQDFNKINSGL